MPAGAAHATKSLSVDLTNGRVDGHRVHGLTVAQVTAALGRPDFHAGPRSHYRIGYGTLRGLLDRRVLPAEWRRRARMVDRLRARPVRDAKLTIWA
jgi:hypothetical protein